MEIQELEWINPQRDLVVQKLILVQTRRWREIELLDKAEGGRRWSEEDKKGKSRDDEKIDHLRKL